MCDCKSAECTECAGNKLIDDTIDWLEENMLREYFLDENLPKHIIEHLIAARDALIKIKQYM